MECWGIDLIAITPLLCYSTTPSFFAVAMAVYDLPLAAICVGLSLLNLFALKLIARRREDLSRSLTLERGRLIGSTQRGTDDRNHQGERA